MQQNISSKCPDIAVLAAADSTWKAGIRTNMSNDRADLPASMGRAQFSRTRRYTRALTRVHFAATSNG
jgi:hypothetical protein